MGVKAEEVVVVVVMKMVSAKRRGWRGRGWGRVAVVVVPDGSLLWNG